MHSYNLEMTVSHPVYTNPSGIGTVPTDQDAVVPQSLSIQEIEAQL